MGVDGQMVGAYLPAEPREQIIALDLKSSHEISATIKQKTRECGEIFVSSNQEVIVLKKDVLTKYEENKRSATVK
jgi:hypothetical protein